MNKFPEMRALRYFLAVAEELHFGRAASRLHVSQPPLSQQIIQLERLLDCRLFDRDRRSVRLTPAGRTLQHHLQRLQGDLQHALSHTQAVARGEEGELRVGYSGSALYAEQVLDAMARFRAAKPGMQLRLVEGVTTEHVQAVSHGRLDLAFVRGRLTGAPSGLRIDVLADERLVVALPVKHRLASRPSLALKSLAGEAWVGLDRRLGTALGHLQDELLASAGLPTQLSMEAGSTHALLGLVCAGMGLSLLPSSVVAQPSKHLRVVPLRDRSARMPLCLISARPASMPIQAFLEASGLKA